MEIAHYVGQVQRHIAAAAELADDSTKQTVAALATAAEAGIRLAILSAVTDAAAEVTTALLDADTGHAPQITVVLDRDEIRIDVATTTPAADVPEPRVDDGDATARISLRLSEALKADIDRAAATDGVSVNTWLVRAAAVALPGRARPSTPQARNTRITGWVTG
ncbi:MAG: type II toxin-antitoxin system HicB family antitoxin [Nocardiaceae bacterium]|nr:type II toxin-antitoxin system HicB family antitoxin [Nocardiaceae bacterium]